MKKLNRCILFGVTSLILISSFLIPITKAQEWTYDGADTTNIPGFSVYPSEWYVFNVTGSGIPSETLYMIEVVKGNISDDLMIGNGTCIWGNGWTWNITSGEKVIGMSDVIHAYWNESIAYASQNIPFIIPVENNGIVSLPILNNISIFYDSILSTMELEHQQVYPSIYSMGFWNTTNNNAYFKANYTDDGIITNFETHLLPGVGNLSLYSQPAQLPPDFSFTTESGSLSVNSTDLTLVVDITDADNNNDGTIDTDYQYRIYNGTDWTTWAAIPATIAYDLGNVATGNYDITMEVKNMYGVASDQIQIQYTAPTGDGNGGIPEIPGYSIVLTSIALLLGISFLIHRNRKKM